MTSQSAKSEDMIVEQGRTDEKTNSSASGSGDGLGQRLRVLRMLKKKGVREAAGELGISPSALSMLENNRGGASLARLKRIAEYFEVGVVDLLTEPRRQVEAAPRFEIIRQCFSTAEGFVRGKGVWYQAMPGLSRGLQISLVTFSPGGGYANDPLSHEGEEAIYVLQGAVVLFYGQKREILNQGDLALLSSETPHAFENSSKVGPASMLASTSEMW